MVMRSCNPGVWEVMEEGLDVQSHLWLHSEFKAILGYMRACGSVGRGHAQHAQSPGSTLSTAYARCDDGALLQSSTQEVEAGGPEAPGHPCLYSEFKI